ncbi:MAG TPA: apolipoprotein N-acyltransferase [Stellaceae bacterium]|nr:apolipoprotein N-acyltransferase [Stellaceae bacterium]
MPEQAGTLEFRGAMPVAPAQLAAIRLAELQGFRRYGAAFLLGVLAAAALPPVDMTPVLIVSFVGLVWLFDGVQRAREAFGIGWGFGLGFFVAGFYWMTAALFVDIARFWWLTPFALLGVPAGLAIFTGGAVLAAHLVCRWLGWRGVSRVLALAVFWCIAEWLRGHVLTGLPWNLVGYAWSGAFPGSLDMLQVTSVVGIYGLSLLTVTAVVLPATLGDLAGRRWPPLVAAAGLVAACFAFGWARLDGAGTPAMQPGIQIRIVQPSIPQTLKNDPAERLANFRRQFDLSREPGAPFNVLIWPEASAPPFLDRDVGARMAIASLLPANGIALVGSDRSDPPPGPLEHFWNSMIAIDHAGIIQGYYDKAHLVPFGEYVPFRSILPIDKITPGTVDFTFGPGPRTLHLPGLPPVSPLICFEVIFPGAVIDPADRPQWLLAISNDAWYGFTSGPFQHFAIARVRAIEEGLPLVRAANNGISGLIDPLGRVVRRLGLDAVGSLDVPLPRALPPTLYEQAGDTLFFAALPLLLGLAWLFAIFTRKTRRTI